MNRRKFLRNAGMATAGAFVAPYILPSGRLFAATGSRVANHVVYCLFAGGVRNLESVHKAEGNLMTNMLSGTESISLDIAPGMDALPSSPLGGVRLQSLGTLFKEFRYANGPAGHYAAHNVAMTGHYVNTAIDLNRPPETPTVFELYRKHSSPSQSALNAWWVANSLGPYPSLNYSSFSGYGAAYGANFIQPLSIISESGLNALGNMKSFSTGQESTAGNIRSFLNQNFKPASYALDSGVFNNEADAALVRQFIENSIDAAVLGQFDNPWGAGAAMNGDMYNIFFATEIIKQFKPELLVVNMQDVDVCHFDYTSYANNLRKADFAVAKLWETIQATPGMANDTVLIIVPEHGRNQQANTVVDAYGRFALDHSAIDSVGGDQMSREIFCMIVGPPGIVSQNQVISSQTGESVDIVPTIANILGFDTAIPSNAALPGRFLQEAFV